MNILTAKQKNDVSHCDTAMPALLFFKQKGPFKREKHYSEETGKTSFASKNKYALHNQYFICFNEQVNRLKKTP